MAAQQRANLPRPDWRRISAVKPEGVSQKAAKEMFLALDEEHGRLLRRSKTGKGARYLVDVDRLRTICPDWGHDGSFIAKDFSSFREEISQIVAELSERVKLLTIRVQALGNRTKKSKPADSE